MMFFVLVAFIALVIVRVESQSGGCQGRTSGVCACSYRPPDGKYFLTAFDDGARCSCGSCSMLGAYFLADRSRFGCGTRVKMCRQDQPSRCVVAGVTDFGPACWVEDKAGGPIIDASKPVCQHLFGTTSCGWSDHYRITATVVSSSTPFGPTTGGGSSDPDPV